MSDFRLSIRHNIKKEAQNAAARRTANSLFKIIQFLFYRVPEKDKNRYFSRIRGKVVRMSPAQLGNKKMPPTTVIGQAVALTKNLLSGLNPVFVKAVMIELTKILATKAPYTPPPPPGQKI